jgi:hypothetical protein
MYSILNYIAFLHIFQSEYSALVRINEELLERKVVAPV